MATLRECQLSTTIESLDEFRCQEASRLYLAGGPNPMECEK